MSSSTKASDTLSDSTLAVPCEPTTTNQDLVETLRILESQLAQAQKLESVGQLAAGIAHELNTPIQFVGDNTRFS